MEKIDQSLFCLPSPSLILSPLFSTNIINKRHVLCNFYSSLFSFSCSCSCSYFLFFSFFLYSLCFFPFPFPFPIPLPCPFPSFPGSSAGVKLFFSVCPCQLPSPLLLSGLFHSVLSQSFPLLSCPAAEQSIGSLGL